VLARQRAVAGLRFVGVKRQSTRFGLSALARSRRAGIGQFDARGLFGALFASRIRTSAAGLTNGSSGAGRALSLAWGRLVVQEFYFRSTRFGGAPAPPAEP